MYTLACKCLTLLREQLLLCKRTRITTLQTTTADTRRAQRRIKAWSVVAEKGVARTSQLLRRAEQLTQWRLHQTSTVLLCTVDSVARMVYELDDAATDAQADTVGWQLGNEALLIIYVVITLRACFCIV
jgi:hypothetical protein